MEEEEEEQGRKEKLKEMGLKQRTGELEPAAARVGLTLREGGSRIEEII